MSNKLSNLSNNDQQFVGTVSLKTDKVNIAPLTGDQSQIVVRMGKAEKVERSISSLICV